ncbi:MAG: hypothetical protein HUJ68_12380, partial [Clostridia bacterium]|nr:hypothetical protein [Clostridia bacterium]
MMKKFISFIFIVFVFLCNLSARDYKTKKADSLREIFESSYFLKDWERNGLKLEDLDKIKSAKELKDYLIKYGYNEDGSPVDNHFFLWTENYDTFFYIHSSKRIKFEFYKNGVTYGTKEEMLALGYVENETMFYYP